MHSLLYNFNLFTNIFRLKLLYSLHKYRRKTLNNIYQMKISFRHFLLWIEFKSRINRNKNHKVLILFSFVLEEIIVYGIMLYAILFT